MILAPTGKCQSFQDLTGLCCFVVHSNVDAVSIGGYTARTLTLILDGVAHGHGDDP